MLHMGTTHTVNAMITVIILVFSVGQCLSPMMMGCIPHKYIHVKCISLFFFVKNCKISCITMNVKQAKRNGCFSSQSMLYSINVQASHYKEKSKSGAVVKHQRKTVVLKTTSNVNGPLFLKRASLHHSIPLVTSLL